MNLSMLVRAAIGLMCSAAALSAQAPVELGFEAGDLGQLPAPWFVPPVIKGWRAELTDAHAAAGKHSVRLAATGKGAAAVGNVMCQVPKAEWVGKKVRLQAQVRIEGGGHAQMWLRVDRENRTMGSFDNMDDRPIRGPSWQAATIDIDIDADAEAINVGFLAFGKATVFVDAVQLESIGRAREHQAASAPKELMPLALANVTAASQLLGYLRFFHPSQALVELDAWDHFAIALLEAAEPAKDARDLVQRLTAVVQPFAPTVQLWAGDATAAPAIPPMPAGTTSLWSWTHHGVGRGVRFKGIYTSSVNKQPVAAPLAADDLAACYRTKSLGAGICVRLPLKVFADDKVTLPKAPLPEAWQQPASLPKLTAENRLTRIAGVALAWGVFQHFYPYFDVVTVDWPAELPVALAAAAIDADETAYLRTLERLVARLQDGHGYVGNQRTNKDCLPVAVAWAGDDLVVVGKAASVGDDVRIGDVVTAIDGRDVATCYAELSLRISAATEGWRRHRSEGMFATMATADPVRLQLRRADGNSAEVSLARTARVVADETRKRPANGTELADGILYFDLNGAPSEALQAVLPALATAKGIVFDLRGYPNTAAKDLVEHLLTEKGTSARWIVPEVELPDQQDLAWQESGRWSLTPREPHLDARIAFVTDGRAISYAESIMGIVEAYKLGEIVGATTAGTNGNVNPFDLPGGFAVSWTGMRVLKHDGSQHHGVGIQPTVPVEPSAAGLAAGRDEVLERAVAVLQAALGR